MARIKVHLFNFHGPTSHSEIILENTSVFPHTYYSIDQWRVPVLRWLESQKYLIPNPNSTLMSILSTSQVFYITADPEEIVSEWVKYWIATFKEASILGKNCAVATQWFLTKYADIPAPNLSNISLNHVFLGLLWWPSVIPSPVALPGRVMSNAKFYLEARNHPDIANYYSKLFLRACLTVSGAAFTASSANISSNNSTVMNTLLTATAGVSSWAFFKSWNLLSAKNVAENDAKKKLGTSAGDATPELGQLS